MVLVLPIVVVVTIAFPLCFQGRTRDPVNQFVPTSPAKIIAAPILVKLVLADFRDDAESLRETKECLEILGIKPATKA